jgi:hypothetical protein
VEFPLTVARECKIANRKTFNLSELVVLVCNRQSDQTNNMNVIDDDDISMKQKCLMWEYLFPRVRAPSSLTNHSPGLQIQRILGTA